MPLMAAAVKTPGWRGLEHNAHLISISLDAVTNESVFNRSSDLDHWPGLGLASLHPSTRGQCQSPHAARAGSRVISGEGCVCIALRRQALWRDNLDERRATIKMRMSR